MSKLKICKITFIVLGALLLLFTVWLMWNVGMSTPWWIFSAISAVISFLGAYAMSAVDYELDARCEWQDGRIEKLKKRLDAQEPRT